MKVFLGVEGLDYTWQEPFYATEICHHCKKDAKIMFVAFEETPGMKHGKEKYVCDLHDATGKEGRFWLHDAMATAVYLCPFCFEATAVVNQA